MILSPLLFKYLTQYAHTYNLLLFIYLISKYTIDITVLTLRKFPFGGRPTFLNDV